MHIQHMVFGLGESSSLSRKVRFLMELTAVCASQLKLFYSGRTNKLYVLKVLLFCPCSQQRSVFPWLALLSKLFLSKLVIIITVRSRLHTSVCSSRKTEPWKNFGLWGISLLTSVLKNVLVSSKGSGNVNPNGLVRHLVQRGRRVKGKEWKKCASGGSPVSH